MKKKIDRDMPIGKVKIIEDFLPPPSQLAFPLDTVRVTISLSKPSVDFFKKQARKYHTKYQRMIREVVTRYAAHHTNTQ